MAATASNSRTSKRFPGNARALLAALVVFAVNWPASAADPVSAILGVACKPPFDDPSPIRNALAGARVIGHALIPAGMPPVRAESKFLLPDGRRVEVDRLFPGGRLRRVGIEVHAPRPSESVRADADCRITEVRRIDYDGAGRAQLIRVFGSDRERLIESIDLNPPPPKAADPGGIAVALIDSGVNYLISPFSDRLARNSDGQLIGYDFWDLDDRPFDIDTGRSAFFPLRHGSTVMSVLISEAPMARILPIRYPRPDMTRMRDVIDWIGARDVLIVNLAMGSNKRSDWIAFAEAAARHPLMLFIVSAGNNGRDIDRQPVYPAALQLPNMIVVTSSENDGRLAQGSNWGASSVDIMVPGERIAVTDHRGAPGKASGSSFAVPRVTALAVRLLAKHPEWRGPELRQAILARARPVAERLVRYGWIPDPSDGPD
ncbi:MAG: S8 family serine peptidase [Proteobacteria bacterium]|nr:S8 family serine peptidase [Pseudomonadota bacterium]